MPCSIAMPEVSLTCSPSGSLSLSLSLALPRSLALALSCLLLLSFYLSGASSDRPTHCFMLFICVFLIPYPLLCCYHPNSWQLGHSLVALLPDPFGFCTPPHYMPVPASSTHSNSSVGGGSTPSLPTCFLPFPHSSSGNSSYPGITTDLSATEIKSL